MSITPKKVVKQFVFPNSLPVADFLHIYELYCRKNFLLADTGYRTWPDITIEEAYNRVVESALTIDDVLHEESSIADSYRQTKALFANLGSGEINAEELRAAFIERRCSLGYSIALLEQFCPDLLEKTHSLRLTFVYAWAACLKDKVSTEMREARIAERHDPNVERYRGALVTFEIECNIEQALRLDEYLQIRIDAYNHWYECLEKALKNPRRVTAGAPDSKVITDFRKRYEGDIPRSLIKRSMHHAMSNWQNWLDSKRKASKHPSTLSKKALNSASISSSYSFHDMGTSLTIGEIKNIAIKGVISGELDLTKEFKYLIINARASRKTLVYTVTGQYKK